MLIDRELTCILGLSICFMLLFAADFSMENIQKTVVSSVTHDRPDFTVNGYTVTGLVYSVFAVSLWFGPYINYAVGTKLTMLLSAFGYLCYVGSYAVEEGWALYGGAVIGGFLSGTLWPAQGHYMIQNSSPQNLARNVAIFWFIYMNASMVGGIFVYFQFRGLSYLDQTTRRTTVYGLMGINVLAILSFLALPRSTNTHKPPETYGPIKTIKKTWSILISARMLWLTVAFSYAGLQQAFWNGIYSSALGFTLAFGNSKELVALSGIFMSIGAVFGAFCPIVFSGWIGSHRFARRSIFLLGVLGHFGTYLIAFLNLPDDSVFDDTEKISLIQPNEYLAMLGSFLLCFGDSCLSTQIYSIIGDYYRDNSAEACSLFKFVKGVFVAVSFYWCGHLGLHTQVLIMTIVGVLGSIAFSMADHNSRPRHDDQQGTTEQPTHRSHFPNS